MLITIPDEAIADQHLTPGDLLMELAIALYRDGRLTMGSGPAATSSQSIEELNAMPIRPAPITYTCSACGWKKTVAPMSDALQPGEYFSVCPSCGSRQVKMEWTRGRLGGKGMGVLERLFRIVETR